MSCVTNRKINVAYFLVPCGVNVCGPVCVVANGTYARRGIARRQTIKQVKQVCIVIDISHKQAILSGMPPGDAVPVDELMVAVRGTGAIDSIQ